MWSSRDAEYHGYKLNLKACVMQMKDLVITEIMKVSTPMGCRQECLMVTVLIKLSDRDTQ